MARVITCGDFSPAGRTALETAARAAAVDLEPCDDPTQIAARLERAGVQGLVMHGTGESAASLAVAARASSRHRQLPIIAVDETVDDDSFRSALNWGADDVVESTHSDALAARLTAVGRHPAEVSGARKGVAVLGEADQARRVAIARVLFAAGFEVRFASTHEEVRDAVLDLRIGLTVFGSDLVDDAGALIEAAVAQGGLARNVVSATGHDYDALRRRLATVRVARVVRDTSPPENVVFMANEMAVPDLVNKRAHPRELYGTRVWFRPEGQDAGDLGFTYNVSGGGLYLRTLARCEADRLWLELTPPRAGRRVRLLAQVAWRRPFGPDGSATAPPGLGVHIIDGTDVDLELWRSCLGAFERA